MAPRRDEPTSLPVNGRALGQLAKASVPAVTARARQAVRTALPFPLLPAPIPAGVEPPPRKRTVGADYDTDWARTYPARFARVVLVEGLVRPTLGALASPTVKGLDRLTDLEGPVVFAANHHSHVDTPLLLTTIPEPWRHRLVIGAAADYFFGNRVTAPLSALVIGAIPIERQKVSRRSAQQAVELIGEGWSFLIFPEGGRSPDGWGQEFKGGAAYLSSRTGAPVVPVFIDGTGAIFGKGMKRPKPGRTRVIFGSPLRPAEGENTRRFNARIEAAVTRLGDEAITDYWTATKRAANGTNPKLTGPEYNGWRREWELSERRKLGAAGLRRRQKRRWPDLG